MFLRNLVLPLRRFCSRPPREKPFARLTGADLAAFERIVGANNVKTTSLETYNTDWSQWYTGSSECVVLPSSTEEVSALLSHCFERKLAVVPQAGNTGLVGGSIPVHDEVVISIRRIDQYFEFDESTGVLQCDAGHILEELDNRLAEKGYMMPFDLGAKGSCLIGGNVATCAGGIRLLRYGSLHAHVLGLTVVLPNVGGPVLRVGSTLRKDNSSLHSPHLFIGSEGQLGIITRVTMTAVPKPISVQSVMLGCDSFEDCRSILGLARQKLGEILSSFELMDRPTMDCLSENLQLHHLLPSNPPFNLLIETSGSNEEHDISKMTSFVDDCLSRGLASDGIQAASHSESAAMWRLRESAPLAVARDGWVWKHDVSLPIEHFYQLTEVIRSRCSHLSKRIVTYGHLGDGNSHLNITAPAFSQQMYDCLYPYLYEWVVSRGGSISAEHGIGQMKLPYSKMGKSTEERVFVRNLKQLIDPRGIMNPYKMIC